MSPFALAWRSLARQPARTALGVLGIAVVGALLFDMLMLSRGLVLSFERVLEEIGFDVRVTATDSMPGWGPPIRSAGRIESALAGLPEIEQVVPVRFGSAVVPHDGNEHTVQIAGHGGAARGVWTLVAGRDLDWSEAGRSGDALPQLLVNRHWQDSLGVAPGDLVSLRGRCERSQWGLPPVDFQVSGVVELSFDTPGRLAGATSLESLERLCSLEPGEVDFFLVASDPAAGTEAALAAIRGALPELRAFSNRQMVSRLEATDFSYFRQISTVLATVTLFFAFLLIATLLTVSVNQRFGEIAALRAIGFTRFRVTADLLWESALFVGLGGLAAIPLALGLAWWLDGILRAMPDFPARLHFFVFSRGALVAYLLLMVSTAVLAALYPVWLAARLPIAATLRRETVG